VWLVAFFLPPIFSSLLPFPFSFVACPSEEKKRKKKKERKERMKERKKERKKKNYF
jgi:hypothetical protein